MRFARAQMSRTKERMIRKPMRFTARGTALLLSILIGIGLLTAAGGAFSHAKLKNASMAKVPPPARLVQPTGETQIKNLFRRLSLQPEADRFRRRLGQRFLAGGEERTVLTGTLTVGGRRHEITMVRTQSDDGEQVEIGLDGKGAGLTWTAALGTQTSNNAPSSDDRSMTERLALDSPDEFIHAQLRMASYYTIARNVMPADAGGDDNYSGPVWDVVRVTEPTGGRGTPLSLVRHYFLNSLSGLLEKVVSDEDGQTIVAEISDWTDQSGELLPTHIVWSTSKEVVMELVISEFSTGPAE